MDSVGRAVYAELGELLSGVHRSAVDSPLFVKRQAKSLDDNERKAWAKSDKARCDFSTHPCLVHAQTFYILSRWKHTRVGRTLTDIKADDSMISRFAREVASLIAQTLGPSLADGGFAIVVPPRRRHKERNFATLVAQDIAALLSIPFYADVCSTHTRQRINVEFELTFKPPEPNLIIFDDFVTTGSTLMSMHNLFAPLGKNMVFFTGVNNKT